MCRTVKRGGEEGGGVTTPTIPPGLVGDTNSLSPSGEPSAPGWVSSILSMLVYSAAPTDGGLTVRGALDRDLPWVGHIPDIPARKGVTVGGKECAELLRLSG